MSDFSYLTGQFLLAMPNMGDPRFDHAAIAMCAHDADGAMGICIGAEHKNIRFHKLLSQFGIDPGLSEDVCVYIGGPVEPGRGFVLHSNDWSGQDSIKVADRWTLTSTIDILRAIAEGRGPTDWIVALGYAGWGGGQLEDELANHAWLTVAADLSIIFNQSTVSPWIRCLRRAGIDPRFLASGGGSA